MSTIDEIIQDARQSFLAHAFDATIILQKENENSVIYNNMPRNMCFLLRALNAIKEKYKEDEQQHVNVTIKITVPNTKILNTTEEIVVVDKQPLPDVIKNLSQKVMTTQSALNELTAIITTLLETSELRCISVTGIFENNSPVGFTSISKSIPVTETDIKIFGEVMANQAEQFKHQMNKYGIQFPSESKIILPK